MLLFLLLCVAVSQGTKFVSYIGQAGPGWSSPGTDEEFLKYIGVPGYGGDIGYNVLNFAFWVSTSDNGGAAVNGAAYDWQTISTRIASSSLRTALTGSASPTAAELRSAIKSLYKTKNIDICISAFGGTDHPMGNGEDAVATGQALAAYAKEYDYDCIDVDWEEAYNGKFSANGGGEEWLCSLTETLHSALQSDGIYITHAPQAPYFMGSTLYQYPNGGYTTVHKNCGDKISWYNVQFYNQGSTKYDSYAALFEEATGWSKNSAVYQIMDGASPENVPVPAEKIVVGKHTLGDGSTFVDGSTLRSIFDSALAAGRWNTGFMTWHFYKELSSADDDRLITKVLGANWPPSAPTPPTTASPTFPPSPTPAPTVPDLSGITVTARAGSGAWWFTCSVSNIPQGISIESVQMRPSGSSQWETGVYKTWSGGYYQFNQNTPFSLPLSFKIKATTGQELTGYDLITSYDEGSSGTMSGSFSSAFSAEDGDAGSDGASWTLWLAVVIVVLLAAAAVVFLVVRRRRTSAKIFFDDSNGIQVAKTKGAGSPVTESTAVLEEDEEQQIVVDVEVDQPIATK